jgi:serine/threonine protein kinase
VQITLSVALDVLTQVARGLRHLHGGGVLHRDLAARNVLVKRRLFKVTDFGLSSVTGDVDAARMTSTTIGPVAWRAPETFHLDDAGQQIASVATDVYMLGGLAFEVLTAGRHVPFFWLSGERLLGVRGSSPMNTLDAAAAAGVTIPWAVVVGDDWTGAVDGVEQLMGLMARCLHAEPSRRPSMDDVLCEMDAIRCGTHVSPDTALPSSEDVYGTVTVTTPDAVVTAAPSPALRLVPPYYVWAAASPLRPPAAAAAAAATPPPRPPPAAAAPHLRPTPAAPAPLPAAAPAPVVAPTEVCVDGSPGVSTLQGAVHNPVPSEVRSC